MPRKWSEAYIDRLLEGAEESDLSELSAVICSAERFDPAGVEYGLPTFAFVFVELMTWTAQAERAGSWTYYEATWPMRQAAMLAGLRAVAPPAYAMIYERGVRGWRDWSEAAAVDAWIALEWPAVAVWARHLLAAHRDDLMTLA